MLVNCVSVGLLNMAQTRISTFLVCCIVVCLVEFCAGCFRQQVPVREINTQNQTETQMRIINDNGITKSSSNDIHHVLSEVYHGHAPLKNYKSKYNIQPNENDIYTFSSNGLPIDARNRPSVGNGHIATVVHTDTVHMNGVYNGRLTASHRAIIPSPVNVNITHISPGDIQPLKRWYSIQAKQGIYQETLFGDHVTLYYRLYAHRKVAPLLVIEIEALRKLSSQSNITIHLNTSQWRTSPDIDFVNQTRTRYDAKYKSGKIKMAESDTSGRTELHVIYDLIPTHLIMASDQRHVTWTFLTSMHVTEALAKDGYAKGTNELRSGTLRTSHVTAWEELWSRGTIELEGDIRLAKMTTGSLYYILSSLPLLDDPKWPFIGLSPNGLPWGNKEVIYYGSVFWDQETWMYPPILSLHQDLGKLLMGTRKRTMASAAVNAKQYGYKGLKYPWESRFTGLETTHWRSAALGELHVNGDIIFAILQYYWATGDDKIFTHDVYDDIITGVADFWISKLQFNSTLGKYVTIDAFGPDEYHPNVNNSVYVNIVAKLTLDAAAELTNGKARNYSEDNTSWTAYNKYKYYADRILVNFDEKNQYHPEYDGYKIGTRIKQADVVMLGYPFMYNMTSQQRRNDMDVYENITDPMGPAMTWCMHTIGWLELGEPQKAYDNIKKTFDNVASDFQVWSEVVHRQGAPNFITGQGGFLQAILFGYGGFRIRPERLDVDFTLPPDVDLIRIIGFDYLEHSMNFEASDKVMNITVTRASEEAKQLTVHQDHNTYTICLDKPLIIARRKAFISQ